MHSYAGKYLNSNQDIQYTNMLLNGEIVREIISDIWSRTFPMYLQHLLNSLLSTGEQEVSKNYNSGLTVLLLPIQCSNEVQSKCFRKISFLDEITLIKLLSSTVPKK